MTEEPITEAEYTRWVAPFDAINQLDHLADGICRLTLMRRLQGGELRAIAASLVAQGGRKQLVLLAAVTWKNLSGSSALWISGDTTIDVPSNRGTVEVQLFGVRFCPEDLARIPRPSPPPQPFYPGPSEYTPVIVSAAPRGRTPNAWWADLWRDIACQLYVGDLKPEKQADVERAILEWAAHNGHEMSERTARTAAQKLWNYEGKKGSN